MDEALYDAGPNWDEDELRELMEEPPGGGNYGRAASAEPEVFGRQIDLSVEAAQERELLKDGGFSVVETSRGSRGGNRWTTTLGAGDAGMTSHRGVTRGDEHVDTDALRAAVEAGLGFTVEEFQRTSRGGRPRNEDRALSERINARLAELHAAGSNFATLALVLGCTPQALGERAKRGQALKKGGFTPTLEGCDEPKRRSSRKSLRLRA